MRKPRVAAAANRPQSRTARMAAYLLLPVLTAVTLVLAPHVYRRWFLPDNAWPSWSAQVLGTRVVRTSPVENSYGSSFLYRLEIDAAWTENGSRREAWIPTNKTDRDQAWLALWAAQQGKRCVVRQSPRNPSARLAFFQ